jgi:membrane protease YdiL (CAAX protease family)
MPIALFEFLTVFILAILPQILVSFYPEKLRVLLVNFPDNWRFLSTLPSRLGVILLILYLALSRQDDLNIMGLNLQNVFSFKTLFAAGFLTVYLLLIFVVVDRRSKRMQPEIRSVQERTLLAMRIPPHAAGLHKALAFVDLWLAVIGEELVYRGYLILMLGRESGSYMPWIIFSLILSVLIHLYQGRHLRLILTHLILAGFFILAMMVAQSLWAAIIPHLVYNTVWLTRTLRRMPAEPLESENGT